MTLGLLLSNVLYKGVISHKGTIYPGEHERIVEPEVWDKVKRQLAPRTQQEVWIPPGPQRRLRSPLISIYWRRERGRDSEYGS